MKNIVIMGAGELGKEVLWLIEDINRIEPTWVILGFLDDTKNLGDTINGYPVIGTMFQLEELSREYDLYAIVAVQSGKDKANIDSDHKNFNRWASIIHPTAVVAPEVRVGDGTIIFPQVTVSVDSNIGRHCLLYIHAIICNDCVLKDYTSVMSGVSLAEHVTVGERSYLSAGCDVYPNINIGKDCKISVGTTVDEDLPDGTEKIRKIRLFHK